MRCDLALRVVNGIDKGRVQMVPDAANTEGDFAFLRFLVQYRVEARHHFEPVHDLIEIEPARRHFLLERDGRDAFGLL